MQQRSLLQALRERRAHGGCAASFPFRGGSIQGERRSRRGCAGEFGCFVNFICSRVGSLRVLGIRAVTWAWWQVVCGDEIVRLDEDQEARIERSFGFASQENVLVVTPSMNKDTTETSCNAAEMTETQFGNEGATGEVTC